MKMFLFINFLLIIRPLKAAEKNKQWTQAGFRFRSGASSENVGSVRSFSFINCNLAVLNCN